jgi:L-threonylcarbamoyladenylate synthase
LVYTGEKLPSMKTDVIRADHPNAIHHAADILKNGGLVSFPTDTVYGLATLPFDEETVERLYVAKGRNTERAIAVLLGEMSQLKLVVKELDENALRLAEKFWPGPLTLIVPRLSTIPNALSPTLTVGVRIPDHPIALSLLRLVGPLAVTSANLSGSENTVNAQQVLSQLDGRIHLILDGGTTPGGVPSTVIECIGDEPKILREGPIPLQELEAVISMA